MYAILYSQRTSKEPTKFTLNIIPAKKYEINYFICLKFLLTLITSLCFIVFMQKTIYKFHNYDKF